MPGIVVFDFDGTVIPGDSVLRLVRFAVKRRCIRPSEVLRAAALGACYRLHWVDAMTAKRAAHAFLTRMEEDRRASFLQDFARTMIASAYPQALQRIGEHKKNGELVILCSASCQCYMQYVAPLLQADALLCTPSDACGGALEPNCRGEEKVRRVRAWMRENARGDWQLTAGYGDSGADAAILSQCAKPVLVNAKRALKRKLPDAERVMWR